MKYIIVMVSFAIATATLPLIGQTTTTNYDEAISMAKEEGKRVLMVFSGSDWCKPCIQLRKEILESAEFQTFQRDQLVVLELDFPYRKKNSLSREQVAHNEKLAEKFNPKGAFPLVLLFDTSQESFKPISYKKGMSSNEFLDKIEVEQTTASFR